MGASAGKMLLLMLVQVRFATGMNLSSMAVRLQLVMTRLGDGGELSVEGAARFAAAGCSGRGGDPIRETVVEPTGVGTRLRQGD